VQAKLDELIRASDGENVFVGIEHLSVEEVEAFRKRCEQAVADVEKQEQKKLAKPKAVRTTKQAKPRKAA
jgi:low affinity Fe/Cu permease